MRIIALQGRQGCGKTATLKRLIEMLHYEKNKFLYEDAHPKGDVSVLYQKTKGDMQYWCTRNGIKIGITTRGDGREFLQEDFFGEKKNFSDRDIVVCAIRSRGGTVGFVKEHGTGGLFIHQKQIVAEDAAAQMAAINAAQAETIFQQLEHLMEEQEKKQ